MPPRRDLSTTNMSEAQLWAMLERSICRSWTEADTLGDRKEISWHCRRAYRCMIELQLRGKQLEFPPF